MLWGRECETEADMEIDLGCWTRPWWDFTLQEALRGIAAAGFPIVGLAPFDDGPVFSADSTEEEIARLKAAVESHGLVPQAVFGNPDLSRELEEAVSLFQREIERVQWLGLPYIVLLGTADEDQYEKWYSAVERCLDFAGERGVMLLLKPHGGLSALAGDLLRAVERFDHPNFGVCYDPGNIYYYTGEKAEQDLPTVVEHVRAMCIKDEVGGKHGEVMITPGVGLVDFERIFSILQDAGFSGPCWLECVGATSLEDINAEAKKAREFVLEVAA